MSKGCVGVFRVRIRRSLGGAHSMLLGCILGLVESGQQHREVVVVDWDGGARFGDLDGLHCPLPVTVTTVSRKVVPPVCIRPKSMSG